MTTRALLMVAFHYPPDATSTGVLRTLKFSQHLSHLGWRCHVVSGPERLYRFRDASSLRAIPESTRVYRPWAADIKRVFGLFGRYPAALGYPDRYWSWVPFASRAAIRISRRERPQALFTTSPFPSAHLIGLRVRRATGLPWLADFRDPWLEDSMPSLEKRIARHYERRVVHEADRILCNTPALRRSFIERYPDVDPARFITLPNGYDEADFTGITPVSGTHFEILHPGVLDDLNRNPRPLLEAAALALHRGWLDRGTFRITFLGAGASAYAPWHTNDIERLSLGDVVRHEARVSHREVLERMARASVILVLNEPVGTGAEIEAIRRWTQLCVPAKVFDALRLGRPMLVIVSGGAIADVVSETGGGSFHEPQDIEGIAGRLRDLAHDAARVPSGPPQSPWTPTPAIQAYSREALSRRLAEELNRLTTGTAPNA